MSDDLPIRRVIGRFDAHDLARHAGRMVLEVTEKLGFRGRWTEHEDFFGRRERLRQLTEQAVLIVRMGVRLRRALRMTMEVVQGRTKCLLVEACEVHVEDPGFVMIEPNGSACRSCHGERA